jgi:hypothetical protein
MREGPASQRISAGSSAPARISVHGQIRPTRAPRLRLSRHRDAARVCAICRSSAQVHDDVPWSTRLLGQIFHGLAFVWIMRFQRPFTLVSRDIRPLL